MAKPYRASRRLISLLTLSLFLFTNHFGQDSFLYASAAAPLTAGIEIKNSPLEVGTIQMPGAIGKVEESFRGSSNETVIVIQDAHSIPDAQKNIQRIIHHFQKQYGVRRVGLEGASSRLDPQIFKSFPDKKLLRQIFSQYLNQGELTAGTGAAIFSEGPLSETEFRGVEDWSLYEEGLGLYLAAVQQQEVLAGKLQAWNLSLAEQKEKSYPEALISLDKKLEAFRRNEADLVETLKALSAVLLPEPGSELSAFLEELKNEKKDQSAVEIEVNRISRLVEKYLKDKKPAEEGKKDLQAYYAQKQEFQISKISAQAFALFLKELIAKDNLKIKVSADLLGGIENQKKMRDIEGTRFFRDLEAYEKRVKSSLMTTEAQRAIDSESEALGLAEKMMRLELSREEWARFGGQMITGSGEFVRAEDFELHEAFYKNAEARDAAFLKNLEKGFGPEPKSAVLVAGGFHAQGLTRRLKEKNTSYLLIMPEIQSIPKDTHYQEQMRDEVSWKSYFKSENGKIDLYKAFVRATRDRLLQADASKGMLKEWRDQIIRDLAEKKQIQRAGEYTQFLDEALGVQSSSLDAQLKAALAKADRFVAGLRGLKERNELTDLNIMKLVRPGAAIPRAPGAALAKGPLATAQPELLRASAPQRTVQRPFGASRFEARPEVPVPSQDISFAIENANRLGRIPAPMSAKTRAVEEPKIREFENSSIKSHAAFMEQLVKTTDVLNRYLQENKIEHYAMMNDDRVGKSKYWVSELARPLLSVKPDLSIYSGEKPFFPQSYEGIDAERPRFRSQWNVLEAMKIQTIVVMDDMIYSGDQLLQQLAPVIEEFDERGTTAEVIIAIPFMKPAGLEKLRIWTEGINTGQSRFRLKHKVTFLIEGTRVMEAKNIAFAHRIPDNRSLDEKIAKYAVIGRTPYNNQGSEFWNFELAQAAELEFNMSEVSAEEMIRERDESESSLDRIRNLPDAEKSIRGLKDRIFQLNHEIGVLNGTVQPVTQIPVSPRSDSKNLLEAGKTVRAENRTLDRRSFLRAAIVAGLTVSGATMGLRDDVRVAPQNRVVRGRSENYSDVAKRLLDKSAITKAEYETLQIETGMQPEVSYEEFQKERFSERVLEKVTAALELIARVQPEIYKTIQTQARHLVVADVAYPAMANVPTGTLILGKQTWENGISDFASLAVAISHESDHLSPGALQDSFEEEIRVRINAVPLFLEVFGENHSATLNLRWEIEQAEAALDLNLKPWDSFFVKSWITGQLGQDPGLPLSQKPGAAENGTISIGHGYELMRKATLMMRGQANQPVVLMGIGVSGERSEYMAMDFAAGNEKKGSIHLDADGKVIYLEWNGKEITNRFEARGEINKSYYDAMARSRKDAWTKIASDLADQRKKGRRGAGAALQTESARAWSLYFFQGKIYEPEAPITFEFDNFTELSDEDRENMAKEPEAGKAYRADPDSDLVLVWRAVDLKQNPPARVFAAPSIMEEVKQRLSALGLSKVQVIANTSLGKADPSKFYTSMRVYGADAQRWKSVLRSGALLAPKESTTRSDLIWALQRKRKAPDVSEMSDQAYRDLFLDVDKEIRELDARSEARNRSDAGEVSDAERSWIKVVGEANWNKIKKASLKNDPAFKLAEELVKAASRNPEATQALVVFMENLDSDLLFQMIKTQPKKFLNWFIDTSKSESKWKYLKGISGKKVFNLEAALENVQLILNPQLRQMLRQWRGGGLLSVRSFNDFKNWVFTAWLEFKSRIQAYIQKIKDWFALRGMNEEKFASDIAAIGQMQLDFLKIHEKGKAALAAATPPSIGKNSFLGKDSFFNREILLKSLTSANPVGDMRAAQERFPKFSKKDAQLFLALFKKLFPDNYRRFYQAFYEGSVNKGGLENFLDLLVHPGVLKNLEQLSAHLKMKGDFVSWRMIFILAGMDEEKLRQLLNFSEGQEIPVVQFGEDAILWLEQAANEKKAAYFERMSLLKASGVESLWFAWPGLFNSGVLIEQFAGLPNEVFSGFLASSAKLEASMRAPFLKLVLKLYLQAETAEQKEKIQNLSIEKVEAWQKNNQEQFALLEGVADNFGAMFLKDPGIELILNMINKKDIRAATVFSEEITSSNVLKHANFLIPYFSNPVIKYENKIDIAVLFGDWIRIASNINAEILQEYLDQLNALFSDGKAGTKALFNTAQGIINQAKLGLLRNLLSNKEGDDGEADAEVTQEVPEWMLQDRRVMVLVSLYFSQGTFDEAAAMRARIKRGLRKLAASGPNQPVGEGYLGPKGEAKNKAEIERLIAKGFDRKLWTEGVAVEGIAQTGMSETAKQEQRDAGAKHVKDVAIKLGFLKESEMDSLTLENSQQVREYINGTIIKRRAEAEAFLHQNGSKNPSDEYEQYEAQLMNILGLMENLERIQSTKGEGEAIRIVISKKDFLDESTVGDCGNSGCFSPTGIHREMPVVHAMESNAFFAIAYDAKGNKKASVVLTLTPEGVVVFGDYNGTNLDLAPLWAEAWIELSRFVPRVFVMPSMAGHFTLNQEKLGDSKQESAFNGKKVTKTATVWTDPYFDFGTVKENGDTDFDLRDPIVLTRAHLEQSGKIKISEERRAQWAAKQTESAPGEGEQTAAPAQDLQTIQASQFMAQISVLFRSDTEANGQWGKNPNAILRPLKQFVTANGLASVLELSNEFQTLANGVFPKGEKPGDFERFLGLAQQVAQSVLRAENRETLPPVISFREHYISRRLDTFYDLRELARVYRPGIENSDLEIEMGQLNITPDLISPGIRAGENQIANLRDEIAQAYGLVEIMKILQRKYGFPEGGPVWTALNHFLYAERTDPGIALIPDNAADEAAAEQFSEEHSRLFTVIDSVLGDAGVLEDARKVISLIEEEEASLALTDETIISGKGSALLEPGHWQHIIRVVETSISARNETRDGVDAEKFNLIASNLAAPAALKAAWEAVAREVDEGESRLSDAQLGQIFELIYGDRRFVSIYTAGRSIYSDPAESMKKIGQVLRAGRTPEDFTKVLSDWAQRKIESVPMSGQPVLLRQAKMTAEAFSQVNPGMATLLLDQAKAKSVYEILTVLRTLTDWRKMEVDPLDGQVKKIEGNQRPVKIAPNVFVLSNTGSFRRHVIYETDGTLAVKNAFEIKIPGDWTGKAEVSSNDFEVGADLILRNPDLEGRVQRGVLVSEFPAPVNALLYGRTAPSTLRVILSDFNRAEHGRLEDYAGLTITGKNRARLQGSGITVQPLIPDNKVESVVDQVVSVLKGIFEAGYVGGRDLIHLQNFVVEERSGGEWFVSLPNDFQGFKKMSSLETVSFEGGFDEAAEAAAEAVIKNSILTSMSGIRSYLQTAFPRQSEMIRQKLSVLDPNAPEFSVNIPFRAENRVEPVSPVLRTLLTERRFPQQPQRPPAQSEKKQQDAPSQVQPDARWSPSVRFQLFAVAKGLVPAEGAFVQGYLRSDVPQSTMRPRDGFFNPGLEAYEALSAAKKRFIADLQAAADHSLDYVIAPAINGFVSPDSEQTLLDLIRLKLKASGDVRLIVYDDSDVNTIEGGLGVLDAYFNLAYEYDNGDALPRSADASYYIYTLRSENRHTDVDAIASVLGGTLGRRVSEVLVNRVDEAFVPGTELNKALAQSGFEYSKFQDSEQIRALLQQKLSELQQAANGNPIGILTLYHQLDDNKDGLNAQEKLLLRILELIIPPVPNDPDKKRLPAEKTKADVFESNLLIYAESVKESVYGFLGIHYGLRAKDPKIQEDACKLCPHSTGVFNNLAGDFAKDLGKFAEVDMMEAYIGDAEYHRPGDPRHLWTEVTDGEGQRFYISLVDSQFQGFDFDTSPDGSRKTGKVNVFQFKTDEERDQILRKRGIVLSGIKVNNGFMKKTLPGLMDLHKTISKFVQAKAVQDESGSKAVKDVVREEALKDFRSYWLTTLLMTALMISSSKVPDDQISLVLSILEDAAKYREENAAGLEVDFGQVSGLLLRIFVAQNRLNPDDYPNPSLTSEGLKMLLQRLGRSEVPSPLLGVVQKLEDSEEQIVRDFEEKLEIVRESEEIARRLIENPDDIILVSRFIGNSPDRLKLVTYNLNLSGYPSSRVEQANAAMQSLLVRAENRTISEDAGGENPWKDLVDLVEELSNRSVQGTLETDSGFTLERTILNRLHFSGISIRDSGAADAKRYAEYARTFGRYLPSESPLRPWLIQIPENIKNSSLPYLMDVISSLERAFWPSNLNEISRDAANKQTIRNLTELVASTQVENAAGQFMNRPVEAFRERDERISAQGQWVTERPVYHLPSIGPDQVWISREDPQARKFIAQDEAELDELAQMMTKREGKAFTRQDILKIITDRMLEILIHAFIGVNDGSRRDLETKLRIYYKPINLKGAAFQSADWPAKLKDRELKYYQGKWYARHGQALTPEQTREADTIGNVPFIENDRYVVLPGGSRIGDATIVFMHNGENYALRLNRISIALAQKGIFYKGNPGDYSAYRERDNNKNWDQAYPTSPKNFWELHVEPSSEKIPRNESRELSDSAAAPRISEELKKMLNAVAAEAENILTRDKKLTPVMKGELAALYKRELDGVTFESKVGPVTLRVKDEQLADAEFNVVNDGGENIGTFHMVFGQTGSKFHIEVEREVRERDRQKGIASGLTEVLREAVPPRVFLKQGIHNRESIEAVINLFPESQRAGLERTGALASALSQKENKDIWDQARSPEWLSQNTVNGKLAKIYGDEIQLRLEGTDLVLLTARRQEALPVLRDTGEVFRKLSTAIVENKTVTRAEAREVKADYLKMGDEVFLQTLRQSVEDYYAAKAEQAGEEDRYKYEAMKQEELKLIDAMNSVPGRSNQKVTVALAGKTMAPSLESIFLSVISSAGDVGTLVPAGTDITPGFMQQLKKQGVGIRPTANASRPVKVDGQSEVPMYVIGQDSSFQVNSAFMPVTLKFREPLSGNDAVMAEQHGQRLAMITLILSARFFSDPTVKTRADLLKKLNEIPAFRNLFSTENNRLVVDATAAWLTILTAARNAKQAAARAA